MQLLSDKTPLEREKFRQFLYKHSKDILNVYFGTEKREGCYGITITPDGYVADCLGFETKRFHVSFVYRHSGATVSRTKELYYDEIDKIIPKVKRKLNLKALLDE